MTRKEIKIKVIQLISELFSDKGFDTDILEYIDLIDDLGMDSITFISIVVEIEAMFKFVVPDEMLLMENFKRVDDIVMAVEQGLTEQIMGVEGGKNDET